MTSKEAAIEVIKNLRGEGFDALLAGGCVRDMLLGREAKDYDVATSAEPRDVIRLFKRTIAIGAQFGVVMVMIEDEQIEVATFRSEGDYLDGRHPSQIEFVSCKEDAARRDFTVNSMFYDPTEENVIDYFDGQRDLKKKVIRTVGKASERFGEDYLRVLRAVRFSTQLGFKIEPATWKAVCANAKNIIKISGERIEMELEAILINPNRTVGAAMFIKSGLAEVVFSGFAGKKAKFAIKALNGLPAEVDFPLAMAAFFADCSVKFASEKCVILMLSRDQNKHIKFLLNNRGKLLKPDMSLAQLKMLLAEPYFDDLFALEQAIQKARNNSTTELEVLKKRIEKLADTELKPDPLLNGHELMELGAKAGPALGQLAKEMYIAQLEGKLKTIEQARGWVRKWLERHKDMNG